MLLDANVDDVDSDEPWCARHHIAVRAWIANIPRTWRSSRIFWTFKRSILGERLEKGRNFPSEYQPGLLSPVWHRSSWPNQGSRKVLPLCNFWDDVWKSLHHVPGAPGHIVTRRDVPYWLIWSLRVYSGPAQSLAPRSWKVFEENMKTVTWLLMMMVIVSTYGDDNDDALARGIRSNKQKVVICSLCAKSTAWHVWTATISLNMVADMEADMVVDMMADMEVDMAADLEVIPVSRFHLTNLSLEPNLVEFLVFLVCKYWNRPSCDCNLFKTIFLSIPPRKCTCWDYIFFILIKYKCKWNAVNYILECWWWH